MFINLYIFVYISGSWLNSSPLIGLPTCMDDYMKTELLIIYEAVRNKFI